MLEDDKISAHNKTILTHESKVAKRKLGYHSSMADLLAAEKEYADGDDRVVKRRKAVLAEEKQLKKSEALLEKSLAKSSQLKDSGSGRIAVLGAIREVNSLSLILYELCTKVFLSRIPCQTLTRIRQYDL